MKKEEIIKKLYPTTIKYRCSKCGKTIEIPHINVDKESDVLKPFCWTFMNFASQYMIHEGWHIRDLGIEDNHPFFCPECWKEGTPEFEKKEYCDDWYQQSREWLKTKINL